MCSSCVSLLKNVSSLLTSFYFVFTFVLTRTGLNTVCLPNSHVFIEGDVIFVTELDKNKLKWNSHHDDYFHPPLRCQAGEKLGLGIVYWFKAIAFALRVTRTQIQNKCATVIIV